MDHKHLSKAKIACAFVWIVVVENSPADTQQGLGNQLALEQWHPKAPLIK